MEPLRADYMKPDMEPLVRALGLRTSLVKEGPYVLPSKQHSCERSAVLLFVCAKRRQLVKVDLKRRVALLPLVRRLADDLESKVYIETSTVAIPPQSDLEVGITDHECRAAKPPPPPVL